MLGKRCCHKIDQKLPLTFADASQRRNHMETNTGFKPLEDDGAGLDTGTMPRKTRRPPVFDYQE